MSSSSASGSQRVAGLDLGTNTFLCLIADIDSVTGAIQAVRDEVRIVRLGEGVDVAKALQPAALARAESCLKEYSEFIKQAGVDKVLAVATSAARDASNGGALLELGKKYGIPIEVISGKREAELTFSGTIESHWQDLTAVIDVGGGSTEIILGDQSGILLRFSADVGSVRLTERFISKHPIPSDEIEQIEYLVRRRLHEGLQKSLNEHNWPALRARIRNVVAVAGTPTTLAAVLTGKAFTAQAIHGFPIPMYTLDELIKDLAAKSVEQRAAMGGMEPKRADVIVAGSICLREAARMLDSTALEVSIRGLRYGVVKELAQWRV